MPRKAIPRPQKPVIELGETDPNLLAESIVSVAAGAKKLLSSKLTKKAVIVLIQDKIGKGVTREQIEQVLDAAADLGSYVRR